MPRGGRTVAPVVSFFIVVITIIIIFGAINTFVLFFARYYLRNILICDAREVGKREQ